MVDQKDKSFRTLAEADDAEKETKTCGEKWAEFQTSFSLFCHTPADEEADMPDLYCYNTPSGWGWLCLFLWSIYAFDALFFAALLSLEVEFGVGVLYGFLCIFLYAVVVLGIVLYFGHNHHLQVEETKRQSRRGFENKEEA